MYEIAYYIAFLSQDKICVQFLIKIHLLLPYWKKGINLSLLQKIKYSLFSWVCWNYSDNIVAMTDRAWHWLMIFQQSHAKWNMKYKNGLVSIIFCVCRTFCSSDACPQVCAVDVNKFYIPYSKAVCYLQRAQITLLLLLLYIAWFIVVCWVWQTLFEDRGVLLLHPLSLALTTMWVIVRLTGI